MIDDRVVKEIARDHRASLSGYAFLVCGSIIESDDVTRTAIVRTFRRRGAPSDIPQALAAVRAEIVAEIMTRARRRAADESQRTVDIAHLAPRSRDPWLGPHGLIHEMLAEFTIPQRACVVLHYVDGLADVDIATLLGLSEGTVGRYLGKAMARVQLTMGAAPGEEPFARVLASGAA